MKETKIIAKAENFTATDNRSIHKFTKRNNIK